MTTRITIDVDGVTISTCVERPSSTVVGALTSLLLELRSGLVAGGAGGNQAGAGGGGGVVKVFTREPAMPSESDDPVGQTPPQSKKPRAAKAAKKDTEPPAEATCPVNGCGYVAATAHGLSVHNARKHKADDVAEGGVRRRTDGSPGRGKEFETALTRSEIMAARAAS